MATHADLIPPDAKRRPTHQEMLARDQEVWSLYTHKHPVVHIAALKNISRQTVYAIIRRKQKELAEFRDVNADLDDALATCDALEAEGWRSVTELTNVLEIELARYREAVEFARLKAQPPPDAGKLITIMRDYGRSKASLIEAIGHQEDRRAKLLGLAPTRVTGEDGKSSIHGATFDDLIKLWQTPIEVVTPEAPPTPPGFED